MDLAALEQAARGRLDPAVYDYVAGGADAELTLADNLAAWARLRLRPRVLRDVRRVDTAASVLGTPLPTPILVAPTAYHGLLHPNGELATAAALPEVVAAVDGRAVVLVDGGVRAVLLGLHEELLRAMALCGAVSLAALTPDLLAGLR